MNYELSLNEQLEQMKLDALAEFAAGAGHEINNPLAIISGHAQLLLKQTNDPEKRRHLTTIISQVQRAYEMIADIRMFARPPQPQVSLFSLDALLHDFVKRMNETWANINFSLIHETNSVENSNIQKDKSPERRLIQSDFAQIMTVLSALGKNAAEAIPDGSVLVSSRLTLISNKEYWEIALEDNGPGIAADIREHIFSPYFSGRSFGRGLGFGLSKSWRLVQQLGGRLSLGSSNRFSQGCRWVLELPVVFDSNNQ